MSEAGPKLRLDKWLWYARFFKTRSLAATVVGSGKVRVNGSTVAKRSVTVGVGDVLTFPKEDDIRVIQIEGLDSQRRGAPEAQLLYTDLAPPQRRVRNVRPDNPGFDGKGRPSKKDRRTYDLSKTQHLE